MRISRRNVLLTGASAAATLAMPAVLARASDKVNLTFSTPITSYGDMLAELSGTFNAQSSTATIAFEGKGDNWDPLLQVTLRDGLVGAMPDGTWQSLTYASLLARRGIVQSANGVMGGPEKLKEIGLSNALIDATVVDGNVYGLPYGTTVPVLYYNMDLLRKAGYAKAEPPVTWDEIHEAGLKVLTLGGNINGGFVEYDATNAWIFQNLLSSFDGRMMNADETEIAFNGPEGLQSLQTLWRFGEINNIDMTREQARQAFNAGASAIHVRSASGTSSVAKAAQGQFELKVGQFPVPSSSGRLVGAGHGFFMFAKDPERQKAAWEFIAFAAGPVGQMVLAKHTGYMPINMLALNDPKFLDQYFAINPYHRSVVERLAITGDQYSFPTDNTVEIVTMMSDEMRKVVTHKESPEAALASMTEQTKKLL